MGDENLPHNIEAQAGASGLPRPGRIGPPEPVEDQLLLAWLEPDAAVADLDVNGVAVLVNSAGIGWAQRTVGKDGVYPLAKFVRIINVNLIGTFNVLRLFAERLATAPPIGEERGVAINTASVAAYEGQIGQIGQRADLGQLVGSSHDLSALTVARSLTCSSRASSATRTPRRRVRAIARGLVFECHDSPLRPRPGLW